MLVLPGPLSAGGEDARKHAIKLLDREVLAHVTVGSSSKRGMHLFFFITNPGKNDNRQTGLNFPDVVDERDAVYLRHIQVDHDDFAIVHLEPARSVEALGQSLASVALLLQISGEETSDRRIVR